MNIIRSDKRLASPLPSPREGSTMRHAYVNREYGGSSVGLKVIGCQFSCYQASLLKTLKNALDI